MPSDPPLPENLDPHRSGKSTDSSEPIGGDPGRGRLVREVPPAGGPHAEPRELPRAEFEDHRLEDRELEDHRLDRGTDTETNAEAARVPVPPGAGSEPVTPRDGAAGGSLRAQSPSEKPPSVDAERDDPDRAEFRRAANGDERAFEVLVERHQDRVFTRLFFLVRNRETAADLTQEAFLRAWRGLPSFREESLFTTWLAKVALNVTRHHWERQRAQKRTRREFSIDAPYRDEDGGGYEIADSTHLPDEWALRNERQKRILEAVGELDPEFREALSLRELHGYSYQEISETLDLPIGTVKSKIFRARQALQEKLKDLL